MSQRRFLFILLVTILMAGCRTQTPVEEQSVTAVLPEGEKRPVEVVLASPQGVTSSPSDYQAVTVVFNQAMHPLTALPQTPQNGPLVLDPPAMGSFHWKGTATVEFRPDEPLPRATTFRGRVAAGTKSWAGSEQTEDFEFEFSTVIPELKSSFPKNKAKWVDPEAPLRLTFNQPISLESARQSLSLYRLDTQGKAIDLPFEVRAAKADDFDEEKAPPLENSLVVEPEKLEGATQYTLKISEGLLGTEGPNGSTSVSLVTFNTYGPLKFSTPEVVTQRPGEALSLNFTNSVKMADLVGHLTFEPEVEIPESYREDDYQWRNHSLYLPLEPRKKYRVTVSKGLKDEFGNELAGSTTFVLKTTDRSPRAQMAGGIGVLEAKGPRSIPLGVRNLNNYSLKMARVKSQDIPKVLGSEHALWSSKAYTPPGGFSVKTSQKIKAPLNQAVDRPVAVAKALGKSPFGFVYYQLNTAKGDRKWGFRGLVQVTDLGLTAKFSPENIVVFVTSLSAGEPVANAQIEVRDQKGKVLWSGKTDGQGTVQAPGWVKLGVKAPESSWDSPDLWVFAKLEKDEAFIRSNGFGGISPWMFDIAFDWQQPAREYGGHAFTERGLYRPGEEVFLKGTVRQKVAGHWNLPELKDLVYKVYDARDKEIEKGDVKLNRFGSFDHKLSLEKGGPTGNYRVVYMLPGGEELFRQSFRVEAFRPAQFEVTVEAPDQPLVAGQKSDFSVKGWYLFGAPMQGEKASWTARLEPHSIVPEGFEGFDFGPSHYHDEQADGAVQLDMKEGQLDDEGLLAGQISLDGLTFKGSGLLVLEGSVTSPTRQKLSGRKRIPVHRGEFQLGLRPTSTFVPSEEPVSVELVAVNPEGDTLQGEQVKLELLRRQWNSVRKADVNGSYRWVVESEDKVVETIEKRTAFKADSFSVTPPEPGFYLVRATAEDDANNPILTLTHFYAHGAGYVPWARSDDDIIELVSDQKRYSPGDTASILVKSPYEKAVALVTVERELVMERSVQVLEGSADTIELPINSDHLPNVFVSVTLVQGRLAEAGFSEAGEDLGKPSFKIGYINLPVESSQKKLQVTVTPDQESYGPGHEVKASLKVLNADGEPVQAEVSLSVADQGVLGLIGYETPDYFDQFYGPRPLRVRSAESRLDVIGQRSYGTKGEDEGGGGGFNAPYREDFRYTAYWNPSIVTNQEGEAEVAFNLPENLTTFRLMATASTTASQFGSGESKLVVNKPLILKPSMPTFVRVGDEFEAGVLAFNNSEQGLGVTVELETEGVETTGHAQTTVMLEPGEERELLFPLKAERPGEATLAFEAIMGAEHDGLKMSFPVQLPAATESVATSGVVEGERRDEKVEVPTTVVPGTATLSVRLASTALSGLDNSVLALIRYPYGCLEQRLSRVAPLILAEELVLAYELDGYSPEELKTKVEQTLADLSGFQRGDGGFGVWTGSKRSSPYLTAHALWIAKLAQDAGYKPDPQVMKKARVYLKNYLAGKVEDPYGYSPDENLAVRAAAVHAQAIWGSPDPGAVSKLFHQRSKMPLLGRVFLLKTARLTGQKKVVETLETEFLQAVKIEAETAHFEVNDEPGWLYRSSVRETGLILQALLESDRDLPVAEKVARWLLEARTQSGDWGGTQKNFAALYGLVSFQKRYEKEPADFVARAILGDKAIAEETFSGRQTQVRSNEQNLKPGQSEQLALVKEGEGRLYYGLTMTYAPAEPVPARDEGFALFKAIFRVSDNEPVNDLRAGETYRVRLSLVTPSERRFVVLEDPVPAGAEVLQTTFATESDSLRELLRRANRNPWWTFNHFETYDDKILLFADGLAAGEHTYEYLIRARLPGTYEVPPSKVHEMYHPEVFGTTVKRRQLIR